MMIKTYLVHLLLKYLKILLSYLESEPTQAPFASLPDKSVSKFYVKFNFPLSYLIAERCHGTKVYSFVDVVFLHRVF